MTRRWLGDTPLSEARTKSLLAYWRNISHRDFLPERTIASLFLEPTDEVEIKKIIRNLEEGATWQDGITANNIKCITDHIASPWPK